ncbi:MAG: molybdenum cofactor biosynthesis protein MoaE [Nitrososphaerota archaeon]|nr:molybdenum cofactor biosynthesis protein MoaE [Nitrososphaerota archaeon]
MRNIATGVYPKKQLKFGSVYSKFISNLNVNTGSVTSFLGVARSESADGEKKTMFLVMESYEEHANRVLKRICAETKTKYKLNDIGIFHALGKFKPGEPIVLVMVSSPRRNASFKALREAVERYKKEPALFKQEIYSDGSSSWIA